MINYKRLTWRKVRIPKLNYRSKDLGKCIPLWKIIASSNCQTIIYQFHRWSRLLFPLLLGVIILFSGFVFHAFDYFGFFSFEMLLLSFNVSVRVFEDIVVTQIQWFFYAFDVLEVSCFDFGCCCVEVEWLWDLSY